jgi:hypothetical protein
MKRGFAIAMAQVKRSRDAPGCQARQIVISIPRDKDVDDLIEMDPDDAGMVLELGLQCFRVC